MKPASADTSSPHSRQANRSSEGSRYCPSTPPNYTFTQIELRNTVSQCALGEADVARRRAGGSGLSTLIILAVIIAWFTGRSSIPSVVLPNGPAVAERSTPNSIEILRPVDDTPTTTAPPAAVA